MSGPARAVGQGGAMAAAPDPTPRPPVLGGDVARPQPDSHPKSAPPVLGGEVARPQPGSHPKSRPPAAATALGPGWFGWLLVAAGCVTGLGSALRWITLEGSGAAAATLFLQSKGGGLGGLDHEGAVTVVLGALAVGLGVAHLLGRAPRLAPWGGLAAGVGSLALVAVAAADGSSIADAFGGAAAGVVQGPGIGMWVTAAGGAVLAAGSLAALAMGAAGRPPSPDQSSTSTSSTDSMIPVSASTTDA